MEIDSNITEEEIWHALKQVVDPELDCNIVDLGLVYKVALAASRAEVTMTFTTPGCPMHQSLIGGVHMALLSLDGIEDVHVEIVWDPPWHPGLIKPEARERLGMA